MGLLTALHDHGGTGILGCIRCDATAKCDGDESLLLAARDRIHGFLGHANVSDWTVLVATVIDVSAGIAKSPTDPVQPSAVR